MGKAEKEKKGKGAMTREGKGKSMGSVSRGKKSKITGEMTIGETIRRYPKTVEVFLSIGMHCVGCPMAGMEAIEQAATGHGIDLKLILDKLNEVA